ncbi:MULTISPECIES: peptide deformylase [Kordiimonas]|uniref:peptide deformylase n=1 Tax=Kordiimonas TaxID=288021 RepID=UPI001FF0E8A1|nr:MULTISPECIES: peptide deformylase [Kordiimonas]MCK0070080.1 peptide deformylase [Kordiimonas laminariae]UTW59162.1 peptide deformylase [Kordiimonas sp. SCSIO 12603]
MAKLDIVNVPDPLLKKMSDPMERVDDEVRRLMDDMLETMYAAPGIGLAAIQVAVPKRVIVLDTEGDADNPQPTFLVNPEVTWESPEFNLYNEGCLSVPEHYAEVERPAEVKVKYLDYDGNEQEELMTGLMATCVQHEIDHLNGVVFIDYLSKLKRNMIIKKVRKATKDATIL